jgi:hypothetical protein
MTLPVAWTDRGPAAESSRLSVDGLVELHSLVKALLTRCDDLERGGSL